MSDPRRTVVFVDGDESLRAAAEAALLADGLHVVLTPRPEEALALLDGGSVAVLVSELVLPRASGLQLLIEARERHPAVPRIALTSVEDLSAAVACINQAEVLRFLRKPCEEDELRAAVGEAVARAGVAHDLHGARVAAERRRQALVDLEARHPGISRAAGGPGGYLVSRHRLKVLAERLGPLPLGPLLANHAQGEG